MRVAVDVIIPDEILDGSNGEAARRVLEEFALQGYRSGQLTHAQIGRLLKFQTPMQVDEFLKEHGIYLEYSEEDFAHDAETSHLLKSLGSK